MTAITAFVLLSACGWLGVVLAVGIARGRGRAIFVAVLMGIYSLIAVANLRAPELCAILPLYAVLHVTVYVNFLGLARPGMKPVVYRILVSWPAAFFAAGTLLALPWALVSACGFRPWGVELPYLAAAIGMYQSLTTKRETIHLVVPGEPGGPAAPKMNGVAPIERRRIGGERVPRPLRIVQLSDTHLGPFMSVARLRGIAERAVAANPDLVLLTGDFLTMESNHAPRLLLDALAPLKALPGKVFACHGNHDHEAPEIVADAMRANGIDLLIDDARDVQTDAGPVQIVGMDFSRRDRQARLAAVCRQHPRTAGALRIVLLHDPGAFRDLPEGQGDLVLSGHTHGGQVGLLSLGFSWTFLRMFGLRLPDHGLWSRGTDRLWVHRGTGHYGFPLRMGVPAEESLLCVHRVEPAAGS
jgi:predicted MPP superfamily phosphohydrolase